MTYQADSFPLPMTEFEIPKHSKRVVVSAGKLLAGQVTDLTPEVYEAFRVAHNWRSSFALPMHRVRHVLRGKVSRSDGKGLTAARLKRMASIRRKLQPGNRTLYQMQDIAGVRAILPSMKDVERVASYFEDGDTPHGLVRQDNYILAPKADGYRSHHLILKFNGDGDEAVYNRQFVEVQLRTKLQHAWATAVEAVGLVRSENLKAGEGMPEWLRFFALMSTEIAEREYPELAASKSDKKARLDEIRALNQKINAVGELESYNQALKYSDRINPSTGRFFLINFNPATKQVSVSPYNEFYPSGRAYNEQDASSPNSNAVLVEVDRVRDLKEAYPNYFLDVRSFVNECQKTLGARLTGSRNVDSMDFSWVSQWSSRGRR